jgi:hypothetical protein
MQLKLLLNFLFFSAISSSIDVPSVPVAPSSYWSPNEMSAFATSLRASATSLVSSLRTIGRSVEGRDIFAFCVGLSCPEDGAGSRTRSSEKESSHSTSSILITALQHAREPAGAIAALHLARDLVDGYLNNNAEIIAIVRTRRVWFAPCINPDAYVYNLAHRGQQDLARKNRKQGGCSNPYDAIGVDLNRNYDFAFNIDNEGSSTVPCAEDFRGEGAFSEPETTSVRNFVGWLASDGGLYVNGNSDGANEAGSNAGNLTVALNWHSFARFINVPYAVRTPAQPQEKLYAGLLSIAGGMSAASGFTYGHPWAGMLYTCNGEASDWMVRRHSVLAFSPEIGPDFKTEPFSLGMWPTEGNMLSSVVSEGIRLQHYAVWATGSFLRIFESSATITQDSITMQIENRGAIRSDGALVISVMHHSAPILQAQSGASSTFSLLSQDGKSSVALPSTPSIKEMLFASKIAPKCITDVFSTNVAISQTGRRNSEEVKGEPIFSSRALQFISKHSLGIEQDDTLPPNAYDDLTLNVGPHSQSHRVHLGPVIDQVLESERNDIHSSHIYSRTLSDSSSSESISGWKGSRLIYTEGLAPFSKISSVRLSTTKVSESTVTKDSNGFSSYVSVSDSTTCTIYGLEQLSSSSSESATLKALFTGSSGCLPCAAFRSTPIQSSQPPSSGSSSPFPESKTSTGVWQDTTLPSPNLKRTLPRIESGNGNGLGNMTLLVYALAGLVLGAAGTYAIVGRLTRSSLPASPRENNRHRTVVVHNEGEEEEEEDEDEDEEKKTSSSSLK